MKDQRLRHSRLSLTPSAAVLAKSCVALVRGGLQLRKH